MKKSIPTRRIPASEEGYLLVFVIFLLALLTLSMAIAAPKIAKEIQRDREVETMHRGKQYIRALKLYYKKFGSYPPTADALIKPSSADGLHFLRKKYVDPTTGKEDWKPVYMFKNKAPTVLGFFGQPVTGSTISAPIIDCSASPTGGGSGASTGGFSIGGSSGAGSSGIGSSTTGNGLIPSPCDSTGTTDGTNGANPNDPNAPGGGSGPGTNPGSNPGSNPSSGQSGQTNGQTFGGGGIIGFSPNSPKESILTYKKKQHYNQWEFVYDSISEQMVNIPGGTGMPGATTNPNGMSATPPNSFMPGSPQGSPFPPPQ